MAEQGCAEYTTKFIVMKMFKSTILFLSGLAYILSACSPEIREIELNSKIKALTVKLLHDSTRNEIEVDLCKLVPLDWDTIYVIGAYQSQSLFDKINLKNQKVIKDFYVDTDDSRTTLMYTKNRTIVGYSYYNNNPPIFDIPLRRQNDIWFINSSSCNKIFLRKNSNKIVPVRLYRKDSRSSY